MMVLLESGLSCSVTAVSFDQMQSGGVQNEYFGAWTLVIEEIIRDTCFTKTFTEILSIGQDKILEGQFPILWIHPYPMCEHCVEPAAPNPALCSLYVYTCSHEGHQNTRIYSLLSYPRSLPSSEPCLEFGVSWGSSQYTVHAVSTLPSKRVCRWSLTMWFDKPTQTKRHTECGR